MTKTQTQENITMNPLLCSISVLTLEMWREQMEVNMVFHCAHLRNPHLKMEKVNQTLAECVA